MDTEISKESQSVEWTIVVQCVKEGENPPIYKIVMKYYGEEPAPLLKCESEQNEWIREQ